MSLLALVAEEANSAVEAAQLTAGDYWLLALLTAAGLPAWIWVAVKWRRGQPPIDYAPRRPAPWNGLVAAVVLFGGMVLPSLVTIMLLEIKGVTIPTSERIPPEVAPPLIAANCVGQIAALLAAVTVLISAAGASWEDMGFDLTHWRRDLALGAFGFLLIVPPINLLHAALLCFWPPDLDTTHPLIKLLGEKPADTLVALAAWRAVIVAPLSEEFFFRAILQGGLESAQERLPPELLRRFPWNIPYAPVVISSLIFAALHAGHGPDPIPIFILALGLGFLYRQTHRILPGLVVHVGLNGLTMLSLWASLRGL